MISGNAIDGLSIANVGTSNNVVAGNLIGTTPDGTGSIANGSYGVLIENGASSEIIGGTSPYQRNVISGNAGFGVYITDSGYGTSGNLVEGNYIGTTADGSTALTNQYIGVQIDNGTYANTVGGTATGAGNVISGNSFDGVLITNSGTSNNLVAGNLIGLDSTGLTALPNTEGVQIADQASDNTVGGLVAATIAASVAGARNVISGNTDAGVVIYDQYTSGNIVEGNYVGTDISGTIGVANVNSGIDLGFSDSGNVIGGSVAGAGNVVSGNYNGIQVTQSAGDFIQGNLVGTDDTGTVALGNTQVGIYLESDAGTTVGGSTAGARNVVSGNAQDQFFVVGAVGDVIAGNYIGTDISGTIGFANVFATGIALYDTGTNDNTIGGLTSTPGSGLGNVISGNQGQGILFTLLHPTGNVIAGNLIGLTADGNSALPNNAGITIEAGEDNTIGGTMAGAGNIISGNATEGIRLANNSTTGNVVQGNWIGLDQSGTVAIPNVYIGVEIDSSAGGNTVGGSTAAARNIISGNGDGVDLDGTGADDNLIEGNWIGLDQSGALALPNTNYDLDIVYGADGNTIGGSVSGTGNVISGDSIAGVVIQGSSNLISGNYIGTDTLGRHRRAECRTGIVLEFGANNTIGGPTSDFQNLISGNSNVGVFLSQSTTGNVLAHNWIGTDSTGQAALGNTLGGVLIGNSASGNVIGGGNVISGNGGAGIELSGTGDVMGNSIGGNFIGVDATGGNALPNFPDGIFLAGAVDTTIGGASISDRNVISGNSRDGIYLLNSTGTVILGNYIGTDSNGASAIGNTTDGIYGDAGDADTTIGGTASGSRNVISGNTYDGVDLGGRIGRLLDRGQFRRHRPGGGLRHPEFGFRGRHPGRNRRYRRRADRRLSQRDLG